MTYVTSGQLGVDVTSFVVPDGLTVPAATYTLGTIVRGNNGTSWVYLKAGEAIGTAAMYVTFDETFVCYKGTKTAVDAGHGIAFAQSATAINSYGWYGLTGNLNVYALASCAADTALYTSATAGALDDDSSGTTKVLGVVLTASVGGSPAAAAGIVAQSGAHT